MKSFAVFLTVILWGQHVNSDPSLSDKIFSVLIKTPETWRPPNVTAPETATERRERIKQIAVGLASVVNTERPKSLSLKDATAAVMTLIVEESGLDYYVHNGEPSYIGHQDHGRARCLGQIQRFPGLSEATWEALGGVDRAATERCLSAMLAILGRQATHCRVSLLSSHRKRKGSPLDRLEAATLMVGYGRNECVPHAKHYQRGLKMIQIRALL